MRKTECIYQKYVDDFKCNYYLLESTKKFVDTGDKMRVFDIEIEKVLTNGEIMDKIKLQNVGINKMDVIEQIKEGQVDVGLLKSN